jgi:large subunit ribosomal protein L21
MDAYAVIKTGGKQYRVQDGDKLTVEKLNGEAGDSIALDEVVAVSNGKDLNVGTPTVDGASVKASIVKHVRGPKVVNYKKKRRKGYERKVGHRQDMTIIQIDSVS